jgi:hypothetical protein
VSGAHRPLPPGGSCASWRSPDTSRTVRAALPHHSTASRSDRPSSAVIVCSASPGAPLRVADRSVAFTERGQHGDRKTIEPAFPVGTFLAQHRLGSNAPTAAPLASSSDDSSLDFSSLEGFTRPKPQTRH